MTKKIINPVDNLWKVKVLREMIEFEEKGWKVTRDSIRDHERTITFIKYGFEEGLKFREEANKKKFTIDKDGK